MAKEKLTVEQTKDLLSRGIPLSEITALTDQGFTFDDFQDVALGREQHASRGQAKSNARHPQISVFSHPEGEDKHPKAKLDRETYFLNTRQYEEQLTPQEIDAFNALDESRVIHKSEGDWTVEVTPRRRRIVVPAANLDQLMTLPNSLLLILRELKEGSEAVDPVNMAKELQALRSRLDAVGA